VSFATVYWIDVFIRQEYFNILIDSIRYCRKNKAMEVYAYCIMPSHVHFVFRSGINDPSGLLRDFKRHTSKKVVEAIKSNLKESRKEWLLWMFEKAGKKNVTTNNYQFWQQNNKPIELWTDKVIQQKIDYIHNNPVKSGFVTDPVDWKYSSARNYQDDDTILEIDNNVYLLGLPKQYGH